ncbi:MAG: phosphoribosylglycinamide formyltransferase [Thermoanaerobaculia bacterium]
MAAGTVPAEIVLVLSNVDGAPGIDRARELGLPTLVVPSRGQSRREHEARVLEAVSAAGAEWVCLAGYMRLLSADFVEAFPARILNIHPSLLPSFPGLHPQRQALAAGVRISGCTVHLVDAGLDSGPIVWQRWAPVLDGDDEAALAAGSSSRSTWLTQRRSRRSSAGRGGSRGEGWFSKILSRGLDSRSRLSYSLAPGRP